MCESFAGVDTLRRAVLSSSFGISFSSSSSDAVDVFVGLFSLDMTVFGLCRMLPVSPADPLPVEFVAGGDGSPDAVDFAALSGVLSWVPRNIADRGRRDEEGIGRGTHPTTATVAGRRRQW